MRGACQVADLTLMIRATRGRSRRPNHMRSLLDALQTLRPVNFQRFPRELHSVAKQGSFEALFVRVPIGFWGVLGRFWEVQMKVKIDTREVFRDAFAERIVESIFLVICLPSKPGFFCPQPVFCKDFHRIDVFDKAWKKLDLGSVLGSQNDEKSRKHSVAKYDFFEHRFSCVFG